MKIILSFVLSLSVLLSNYCSAQTKSKTQKTATTKSSASNKMTCTFCKGTGKGRFPVDCPNCINWNAEYRRKVPCHVCKDTRTVYQEKCPMCDGTGKLDKDWYKFGLSDKELDTAMKQASKYNKEIPASGQVMTDDQAWKMFNEFANTHLKQKGYYGVRQTLMDDYSMRPKESNMQYVENFKEDSLKEQREEKENQETEEKRNQTWNKLLQKRNELRQFFPYKFQIKQGIDDDEIVVYGDVDYDVSYRGIGPNIEKRYTEIGFKSFDIVGELIFIYFEPIQNMKSRGLSFDPYCIAYDAQLNSVYGDRGKGVAKKFYYDTNGVRNQFFYFSDNTLVNSMGKFLFKNPFNENHIAFLTSAKTAKNFNEELSIKQETGYRYLVSFDKDYLYFDVIDLQQSLKVYEHVEASKADQYCKKLFK